MPNRITSRIEFPVLNDDAKAELKSLFVDLPENENGYAEFENVIMKVVGVSDPSEFDRKKYFDNNWCEIEEINLDGDTIEIRLISAWAAPKDALHELAIYLGKIDNNIIITHFYDDDYHPAEFFGWASYLAHGLDEGEQIESDQYHQIASEIDPSVADMDVDGEEYTEYMEENYSDMFYTYVTDKLRFEVKWNKENNYGRGDEEDD